MRAFFFFMCLFWLLANCAGCATPYNSWNRGYYQPYHFAGASMLRPASVLPPGVAVLDGSPLGWSKHDPLSFRVENNTGMWSRCYIGVQEIVPAVEYAGPPAMLLQTGNRMCPVHVMHPGGWTSDQLDRPDTYVIRCQMFTLNIRSNTLRYVGSAVHKFTTNMEGGRTFYVNSFSQESGGYLPSC